jgi:hypothetical protein
MRTGKRIALSFGLCLLGVMGLTVIYGARSGFIGHDSLEGLWYLWIIQFAVLRCIILALIATPLAAWALQSYAALKWMALLFFLLSVWVLLARAEPGARLIIFGGLLFCAAGFIAIRLICRKT